MKQSEIRVGAVYRNRGKGTTQRRVVGIGESLVPDRRFSDSRPDKWIGVEYQQRLPGGTLWSEKKRLWIDSFVSWAGSEVTE